MSELWVLDGDPLFNLLTSLIDALDLFNLVDLRNWLLRFLRGLQFLIFLDNRVSSLKSIQLFSNLLLREWESTNHLEDWFDRICIDAQLTETDVLKGPIARHHLTKTLDGRGGIQLGVAG